MTDPTTDSNVFDTSLGLPDLDLAKAARLLGARLLDERAAPLVGAAVAAIEEKASPRASEAVALGALRCAPALMGLAGVAADRCALLPGLSDVAGAVDTALSVADTVGTVCSAANTALDVLSGAGRLLCLAGLACPSARPPAARPVSSAPYLGSCGAGRGACVSGGPGFLERVCFEAGCEE